MTAKILILLDTVNVRNEVIEYSLELAKRMNASVILLWLLTYGTEETARMERKHPDDFNKYINDEMITHMKKIHTQGVNVEAELRLGNPSSELMKFLAEIGPVETIVWGGESDVFSRKGMNKKSHWLMKIKNLVKCPVVFPVKVKMEC